MIHKHYLECEAPICADERAYKDNPNWKEDVIWYPGEPFCGKMPYTSWQRKQVKINRLFDKGLLKHGDRYYFNANMLAKMKAVRRGIKGRNPDRKTWER